MDNDRPAKDDLPERRMDPRRVPFNVNRETAFSQWAKQRGNRSTNIEFRRPQTEDEVELAEMRQYLLGLQNNEAWRQDNSVLEKMLGRVPPARGTIAHDAGAANVGRIPSRTPRQWANQDVEAPLLLPPVELHPPIDQYGRDLVDAYKASRWSNEIADLDPAEQIVDDVIHGKQ